MKKNILPILLFFSLSACKPSEQAKLVVTTGDLNTIMQETTITSGGSTDSVVANIRLYPDSALQMIKGIGCTYSEATSYNLMRLPQNVRSKVLNAYFSEQGSNFSMIRTVINSCDASSEYYSYDEVENDTLMEHFSIQKDIDNGMIPMLKNILRIKPDMSMFASPWTPPVWMKNSKQHNNGYLLQHYYSAWAKYLSRYLSAYEKEGIHIGGITPQNEPMAYWQKWDACGWNSTTMKEFMGNYLIPELNRNGQSDVKVIGYDHNKNSMNAWIDTLMTHPVIAQRMSGVAHHWYEDGEGKNFAPVGQIAQKYPSFDIIASEQGVFGLYVGQVEPAELYATDIIENFNNGTHAWILWGMLFDIHGKPNHGDNFNHTPIMADVEQGKLQYNPSYYYITQISKYIDKNTLRIAHSNASKLVVTAFKTERNTVCVLLNKEAEAQKISISIGKISYVVDVPAKSIITFIQ